MIEHVAASWWSWIVTTTWQVGLLVVIIGIVDRLIRSWAWPQVRHALWLLVLVKLVVPPGWGLPTAVIPAVGQRLAAVVPAVPSSGAVDRAAGRPDALAEAARGGAVPAASAGSEALPAVDRDTGQGSSSIPWRSGLLVVWLAGMTVFTIVLLRRTARLARWHRTQPERPTVPEWFYDLLIRTGRRLKVDRLPAVVFSDEAVTPAVYGVFRPVLLLPAHSLDRLDEEEAEHLLLHELAHLKRGDLLVQAAVLVLQVVHWFNPFVGVARRQIKHVREICCDLTVASVLQDRTPAYRKTLRDTARGLLTESVEPSLGLLGVFEEPSRLLARMHWLAGDAWRRHRVMLATAAAVALLAAPFVLPTAAAPAAARLDPVAGEDSAAGAGSETTVRTPPAEPDGDGYTVVRNEFREETVVLGFAVDTKKRATSTTWIGTDIVAGTERNRTTIVDLARSTLTFIDHDTEVWIEAPLPLDVPSLLTEEMQRRWRGIRTTGTVDPTRSTERILGRRCRAFEVTSWNVTGGGELSDQTTFTAWVTTEVPFDLAVLDALLLNLRVMYNRDEAYREELAKMPGLQMRLELRHGNLLSGKRLVDEVVEISQGTPPPGTFEPPEGYRRVDRIATLDL